MRACRDISKAIVRGRKYFATPSLYKVRQSFIELQILSQSLECQQVSHNICVDCQLHLSAVYLYSLVLLDKSITAKPTTELATSGGTPWTQVRAALEFLQVADFQKCLAKWQTFHLYFSFPNVKNHFLKCVYRYKFCLACDSHLKVLKKNPNWSE